MFSNNCLDIKYILLALTLKIPILFINFSIFFFLILQNVQVYYILDKYFLLHCLHLNLYIVQIKEQKLIRVNLFVCLRGIGVVG